LRKDTNLIKSTNVCEDQHSPMTSDALVRAVPRIYVEKVIKLSCSFWETSYAFWK